MPAQSLAGKVALVTGAGKGIGRAIATALAKAGCKLALNARTASDLEVLKQTLENQYQTSVFISVGSVADADYDAALVEETLKIYGKIDILINNAGVAPQFVLLQELSIEEIHATIDINLKGPLFLSRAVVPGMVNQGGGYIINLNSIAGKVPYAYSTTYCASKFGLSGMSASLAAEQRENGIHVVDILPGEVLTPMWKGIEPYTEHDPEKFLDVENIVEAILYVLTQPSKVWVKDITVLPQHPPEH